MKIGTLKLVPLAALAALLASAGFAGAQTAIDVKGTVGVSSRQLFVQDLLGVDLTSFDFGTGGSIPFQVRVEDDNFANEGFTVDATMTNLYLDDGGLDFDAIKIPSAKVRIDALPVPLSVLDDVIQIQATITPVFDAVTEINSAVICPLLGFGLLSTECELEMTDVQGVAQTVTFAVDDLADLTKLPIAPQAPEAGPFTDPDFEGDAAGDPAAGTAGPPTARQVLGGTVIGDLSVLTGLLDAQLGPLADLDALARNALIPEASFQVAVQEAVDVLVPGVTLTAGQLGTILGGLTTLTRDVLDVGQIISQTGAYRSFPVLVLEIPDGTPAGSYRGTLVITDIQP